MLSSLAEPYLHILAAIAKQEDDIDSRITLSTLLMEEGKEDEAISLLSPLKCSSNAHLILFDHFSFS